MGREGEENGREGMEGNGRGGTGKEGEGKEKGREKSKHLLRLVPILTGWVFVVLLLVKA